MIISDIRELASLDFSVTGVTAKSERWTSRPTIDYSKSGRSKNLIHIITSGIRAYLYDGEKFELSAALSRSFPKERGTRPGRSEAAQASARCFPSQTRHSR